MRGVQDAVQAQRFRVFRRHRVGSVQRVSCRMLGAVADGMGRHLQLLHGHRCQTDETRLGVAAHKVFGDRAGDAAISQR